MYYVFFQRVPSQLYSSAATPKQASCRHNCRCSTFHQVTYAVESYVVHKVRIRRVEMSRLCTSLFGMHARGGPILDVFTNGDKFRSLPFHSSIMQLDVFLPVRRKRRVTQLPISAPFCWFQYNHFIRVVPRHVPMSLPGNFVRGGASHPSRSSRLVPGVHIEK